jgi:hypothetical protein
MKSPLQTFLFGAGLGAAFLIGRATESWASPAASTLDAQGRGPVNVPPPSEPVPGEENGNEPVVFPGDSGQAAVSANGFLAVTGSYGVGTSVLYLVDTENRQLAVYEARGGALAQRRIVLVGARRIDLDLQLHGYNDRSEYEYSDLLKLFEKRDRKAGSAPAVQVPGGGAPK